MHLNIIITDSDNKKEEYSYDSFSDFMELLEANDNNLDIPMIYDVIDSLNYIGSDREFCWNREDILMMGINDIDDLYQWLISNECDIFG